MALNLDSKLSRLILRFYFMGISSLGNWHKILWCWKINFHEGISAHVQGKGSTLQSLGYFAYWTDDMDVFLTQAFAFTLPWITWSAAVGWQISPEVKQGCYHHADWFIFTMLLRCLRHKPQHLPHCFFPPSDKNKRKWRLSSAHFLPWFIQSLATRVSTLGHIAMIVITLKPNL